MIPRQFRPLAVIWFHCATVIVSKLHAVPIRAHFISGARECESEASMKTFTKWTSARHDIEFTGSWGHDGIQILFKWGQNKRADILKF